MGGTKRQGSSALHVSMPPLHPAHRQFVDTPGNLPASMNLSYLLGLQKNISILQAYQ